MKKGENFNHPQKGSRIEVAPIRKEKDIKAILKLGIIAQKGGNPHSKTDN